MAENTIFAKNSLNFAEKTQIIVAKEKILC